MKILKILVHVASIFLLSALASVSVADDERRGVELGLGYSYSDFNADDLLDSGDGWVGQLGYRFNNTWSAELMRTDVSHNASSVSGLDADVNHTMVNALYHFNGGGQLEPYVSLGAGRYDIESLEENAFNLGAGLKYYFNDRFLIRPDIRFNNIQGDVDESFFDANLIFSFTFGGPSKQAKPKKTKALADSDADGVADSADQCPTSPASSKVNAVGCSLDSDGDGVVDHLDTCPETKFGLSVDGKGCAVVLEEPVSIKLNVLFDNNSDLVKETYYPEIQKVADFLMQYKGTSAVIEGHTDTRGSATYNKDLSQRRADSVAKVLVEVMNISSNRVSAIGYGEELPLVEAASTEEEHQANRRVIAEISAELEKQ